MANSEALGELPAPDGVSRDDQVQRYLSVLVHSVYSPAVGTATLKQCKRQVVSAIHRHRMSPSRSFLVVVIIKPEPTTNTYFSPIVALDPCLCPNSFPYSSRHVACPFTVQLPFIKGECKDISVPLRYDVT